jgi:putative two-component system response regulator
MQNQKTKIVIAEDEPGNRRLLEKIISYHTDYTIFAEENGKKALEVCINEQPDLILLDVRMPEMDGFQTATALKKNPHTANIPIIFITGLDDLENKVKAFKLGGADYIIKPFEFEEVISRISTHIRLKKLVDSLESEVEKRTAEIIRGTKEIERLNLILVSALESANYYKDDDTGNHIKRISHYSNIIAEELGLDSEMCEEIARYSSLHDIGKVGIPDSILKKPARLTPEEFEIMKTHSNIGYNMIDYPEISIVAKNIVRYHHEKWSGEGYPLGLSKEKIPVESRIVAIADVYDALRSRRPYKPPFPAEQSEQIIIDSAGSHFDPELVETFKKNKSIFCDIFNELCDEESKR